MAAAKSTTSKKKQTASSKAAAKSQRAKIKKAPAKAPNKPVVKTKPKSTKSKAPSTKSKAVTKSVSKKTSKPKSMKTKPVAKKKAVAKKTTAKKPVVKNTAKSKAPTPSNRKAATKKAAAKKIVKKTATPKKITPKKVNAPIAASKKPVAPKKPAPRRKPAARKSNTPEFPPTSWGSGAEIYFEATEHLPPRELTCVAGGFVFYQDKLVLANIPGRGWEVIGGRIDIGETAEETFRREAEQQIGVTFSKVKMLGVIRIQHTGPEPPNCPYPYPVGYGIQYIAIADELNPFHGGEESLGRSLISADGLKEHYFDWNEHNEAVFKYAFSVYHKWRKKLSK